jgi:hypothetical protein
MHKIFRTDETLKPSEISSLLGIDVEIDEIAAKRRRSRQLSTTQIISMTLVTILLAAGGVVIAMYVYEVGIFHPTVSAFGK